MNNLLISSALYADIAVVLIMLIFIFSGISKGFIKSILSFFGTIAALIIAYLLCKSFAGFLDDKFNLISKLTEVTEGFLLKNNKFAIELSAQNLETSLKDANIPGFMVSVIIQLPIVTQNAYPQGTTLASLIAPVLANYEILIISFLALFIIIKLLLLILKRFADAVKKIKIVDAIDKILGFVVGAIEGTVLIYIILIIISLFPSLMAKPLKYVKESTVANYLYETDLLGKAFEKVIDKEKLNEKINDYIKGKEEEEQEEQEAYVIAFGGQRIA